MTQEIKEIAVNILTAKDQNDIHTIAEMLLKLSEKVKVEKEAKSEAG